MKRNEGYTLIEVIIVIAIMAILSGLSFATIGIIHKARYNTAISNFENQITSLSVITKATSQAKTQTVRESDSSYAVNEVYPLSMLLQKNADGTYWLIFGYYTSSGFEPKNADAENAIQNKDIIEIPDILTITYTPSVVAQDAGIASGANYGADEEPLALFEFNKSDGSVKYGAGKYEFVYSGRVVGTVSLDSATGNTKVGKVKEPESSGSSENADSE